MRSEKEIAEAMLRLEKSLNDIETVASVDSALNKNIDITVKQLIMNQAIVALDMLKWIKCEDSNFAKAYLDPGKRFDNAQNN